MTNKTDNLKRKQQMTELVAMKSEPNLDVSKKMKMDEIKQYLMPVHIVTCGLQGADLGRDETAIIEICVNLIDVSKMEIIGERSIILQASSLLDDDADPEKIHISIPAREMTGLLANPNKTSHINLKMALEEIDNFIRNYTSNDSGCEMDIIPVTVGHLPLRGVLHREARFRGIVLSSYWYHYLDLCEQMSFCYHSSFTSMKDICTVLQMVHCELSVAIICNMSHTVLCLLKYGHVFGSRHVVTTIYKPIVFHVDDPIDDDVVVVIKPIDYKTPISQVLPFFNGVNIADGGVAVMMSDGRRSNKILVRLSEKTQRDIALLRDKHHLEPGSTRYITMSTFDSREFMKIAGYEDENIRDYLQYLTTHEQVLIRMKGLPFTVTKDEILQFFNSHKTEVQMGLQGIFLVQKPSGDLNGDAFIIFGDNVEASKATGLKGSMIGNRYVEIFHSTPAELNQVIAGIKTGTNLSKMIKRPNKSGRELENVDSISSLYQGQLSLLNRGLLQNILCNKPDQVQGATLTSFIPADATDNDFVNFLGECQAICINITRYHLNNPKGYTSYIARFKDTQDALLTLKYLSEKLFKLDIINQEFQVKTTILPLTGQSLFKSLSTHSPLLQKSPLGAINIVPSVFPISPTLLQPSFTMQNQLQMANGTLLNYGTLPSLYPLNQYSQLNFLSNALQSNILTTQLQAPLTFQTPVISAYMPTTELNINVSNNNVFMQKHPLMPLVSQSVVTDKSRIILLYGVQIPISQQDLDILFGSLIPYISAPPKLYQTNNLFYAIFDTAEDTKVALNRCPIILYKNQTIYLISIN